MTAISWSRRRSWRPRTALAFTLDRDVRLGYLLLLPVLVAVVAWSYVLELSSWRLDVMQAADRAGLYLFFLSPCYAAVSAWAAVRAGQGLGEIIGGLPAPTLVWRRAWLPYAGFGLVAHALVLALMVLTAWWSDAIGTVEPLAVVVQLLSIPFFAALGALCGGLVGSRLTPPALLLAMLAGNTVLVNFGFRRISQVGTGSADFVDLQLSTAYLLPKAGLFAALTLFAWPLRGWATGRLRLLRSGCAVVAAVCAVVSFTSSGQPQVYRPSPLACHPAADVEICVPADLAARAAALDAAVERTGQLVAALRPVGVPTRVVAVSRGATTLPRGAVVVTVTATDLRVPEALQRAVDFGFAYAQSCDDPMSTTGPPDDVILTRALLDGWLQQQTGAVEAGSFPEQTLSALQDLPAQERDQTLRRLFTAVWSCDQHLQPFEPPR